MKKDENSEKARSAYISKQETSFNKTIQLLYLSG
jgi:hypothetical protein